MTRGPSGGPSNGPLGSRVRVLARKWPDRPHWQHDTRWLGEDEHGVWVGAAAGTTLSRPGVSLVTDQAQVTLLPREQPFVATFYARDGASPFEVYVDITTVPSWASALGSVPGPVEGAVTVTAVDLDLDVLRGWSGRVWVDDEDDFARHRVRYAYPDDLVRLAVSSCEAVHEAVAGRRAPYDGTAQRWLTALGELVEPVARQPVGAS